MILDEEQQLLQETVREYLESAGSLETTRERLERREWIDAALWNALRSELNLVGIHVAEAEGGAGGGLLEACLSVEASASALVPAPLVWALMAVDAVRAADSSDARAALLEELASGAASAIFAPAGLTIAGATGGAGLSGSIEWIPDEPGSRVVLLLDHEPAIAVFEVRAPGVTTTPLSSLDLTQRFIRAELDSVDATVLPLSRAAADNLRRRVGVLLAADSVGLLAAQLASLVDYSRTRHAFGRLIGSFQALKHQLVDSLVCLQSARALTLDAALALDTDRDDATLAAACAEVYVLPRIAHATVELQRLYGGIGFTWEHDAHLYSKRAMFDSVALGSDAVARQIVSAHLSAARPPS